MAKVDEGLDRVDVLPAGSGFFDLRAAVTLEAVMARAEVGHKLDDTWSAFAFAEADHRWGRDWGASVGFGIKGTW